MDGFNLKKIYEIEVKEKFLLEISNRFEVFEKLYDDVCID
jgi:hypothetical protein